MCSPLQHPIAALKNAGLACLAGRGQSWSLGGQESAIESRNLAAASQEVGGKETIADVVRVFEQQSPILKNFGNLQRRSTGRTFNFTRFTTPAAQGLAKGYVKTEGVAGTEDTTFTIGMADVAFSTYSSQKVVVTNELLDDAAADISKEVVTFGMAKSTMKFNDDCITALLLGNAGQISAATTWALQDLASSYYSIPNRNRYGVKYLMNGPTAALLVSQLTVVSEQDLPTSLILRPRTLLLI